MNLLVVSTVNIPWRLMISYQHSRTETMQALVRQYIVCWSFPWNRINGQEIATYELGTLSYMVVGAWINICTLDISWVSLDLNVLYFCIAGL